MIADETLVGRVPRSPERPVALGAPLGGASSPHEIITVVSRQPSEGPHEHAVVALLLTALPGDAEQTLQGGQLDGLTDGVADGSHGLER